MTFSTRSGSFIISICTSIRPFETYIGDDSVLFKNSGQENQPDDEHQYWHQNKDYCDEDVDGVVLLVSDVLVRVLGVEGNIGG